MTKCADGAVVDIGTWIKGDTIAEFELQLMKKDAEGKRTPYVLLAGDVVNFELRSIDRPGSSPLSPDFTIVDLDTGKLKITNPGVDWTPPAGHDRERFDGFTRIVRGGLSGYAFPEQGEAFRLTLRTAP